MSKRKTLLSPFEQDFGDAKRHEIACPDWNLVFENTLILECILRSCNSAKDFNALAHISPFARALTADGTLLRKDAEKAFPAIRPPPTAQLIYSVGINGNQYSVTIGSETAAFYLNHYEDDYEDFLNLFSVAQKKHNFDSNGSYEDSGQSNIVVSRTYYQVCKKPRAGEFYPRCFNWLANFLRPHVSKFCADSHPFAYFGVVFYVAKENNEAIE